MPQLDALRAARTIQDVAALLAFKPKALAYLLYRKNSVTKYSRFQIAKRGGGVRDIDAPAPDLKGLQRNLSDLLQDCVDEINQHYGRKDGLAHGFKRQRSIVTNATKHRRKRFVFNIDLHDFFGTINFGRVRGYFLINRDFALDPKVATILAQIACFNNALPQGSPCSPVISNLIGQVLDIRLFKLASKTNCTYSRYADDITFSTNERVFPASIAIQNPASPHSWQPAPMLEDIILRGGFTINPKKTRMLYRESRQDVTGLVVNSKVNIRNEYRHTVRAMAHRLFKTGSFEIIRYLPNPSGVLTATRATGTLEELHGMLGHINRVDQHNAKVFATAQGNIRKKVNGLGSKEVLYRSFLTFKELYSATRPTVLCEGKTDNVYLKYAIHRLAANYPELATISSAKAVTLNVRLFKYTQTSTGRILRLNGGTGEFQEFIINYKAEIAKFKAPGLQEPVILLIDYDKGAEPVRNTVKSVANYTMTGKESFVHVFGNLYVVATPLKHGQSESSIEDCFSDATKQHVISGKTFNPNGNFDPALHYGKHVFSDYIAKNAAAIDFNGFGEVLGRISSAIKAHAQWVSP
jgi:RNA-directed DNA polymerase